MTEPKPTCLGWTAHGHCIRDEGHDGQHMPLPKRYPPRRLPDHLRIDTVNDYLRQKGEM